MKTIYSNAPHRGWLPWGVLSPILAIAFVVMAILPFELVFMRLGWLSQAGDPVGVLGLVLYLLLPFSTLALLVVLWVRYVEKRSLATIGLVLPGRRRFFKGHLVGVLTVLMVVGSIAVSGGYELAAVFPAFFDPRALIGIAILAVAFAVQSSAEELLFRGWLLSAVNRKLGIWAAVIANAAVFTLLHFTPHQSMWVTASSVGFAVFTCCWAIRHGQVWGVMGWHAAWNWLMGTGFGVPITGLTVDAPALMASLRPVAADWLTGGTEGPEGSLWCVLFFAVGSIYLLAQGGPRNQRSPNDAPAD